MKIIEFEGKKYWEVPEIKYDECDGCVFKDRAPCPADMDGYTCWNAILVEYSPTDPERTLPTKPDPRTGWGETTLKIGDKVFIEMDVYMVTEHTVILAAVCNPFERIYLARETVSKLRK